MSLSIISIENEIAERVTFYGLISEFAKKQTRRILGSRYHVNKILSVLNYIILHDTKSITLLAFVSLPCYSCNIIMSIMFISNKAF